MTPEPSSITVTSVAAGRVTVDIAGELDALAVAPIERAVHPHLGGEVTMSMSGVTFMDSSALKCLLTLRQNAAREGGRLTVAEPSAIVRRVIEISGVGDALLGP